LVKIQQDYTNLNSFINSEIENLWNKFNGAKTHFFEIDICIKSIGKPKSANLTRDGFT